MKKVYRLAEVDCANCARKMEEGIRKINGVTSASVSFLTEKLTIEYDDAEEKRIIDEVRKCIKRVDPDSDIELK